MVKTVLPWALLAAVAVFTAYYFGNNQNKEEIARVEKQIVDMKSQRDSIQNLVAVKDSIQKILQSRVSELKIDADNLRGQVSALEELRRERQLNVRRIQTPDDLLIKFSDTFPELPKDKIRVFEEYFRETDITLKYFGVPIWFSETFIIEHQNSENYKQQRDKLETLDSLNVEVIALNDKVLVLEKEKSEAYRTGYDSAYVNYMEISRLYIDELEKPRFGLPHWGVIAGAAAAGFIAGNSGK